MENTGSVLAEDVIQKSEIIKNYFMESRAGEEFYYDSLRGETLIKGVDIEIHSNTDQWIAK